MHIVVSQHIAEPIPLSLHLLRIYLLDSIPWSNHKHCLHPKFHGLSPVTEIYR